MAFPTVVSAAAYQYATASTTHNVPGVSPSAGQLILHFVAIENGGTTVTTPADFTLLAEDDVAANTTGASGRLLIYAKVATGSEGTTDVNYASSASRTGVAHQYIISGWGGTIATDIDVSAATIPNASDPGSVTADWGSDDNLFIAVGAIFDDDLNYTAAPANYSNLLNQVSGNGTLGTGAGLGSARRELAAASDDPGVFTVEVGTGTFEFVTTLVIKPAVGGGPVVVNPDTRKYAPSGFLSTLLTM